MLLPMQDQAIHWIILGHRLIWI